MQALTFQRLSMLIMYDNNMHYFNCVSDYDNSQHSGMGCKTETNHFVIEVLFIEEIADCNIFVVCE